MMLAVFNGTRAAAAQQPCSHFLPRQSPYAEEYFDQIREVGTPIIILADGEPLLLKQEIFPQGGQRASAFEVEIFPAQERLEILRE